MKTESMLNLFSRYQKHSYIVDTTNSRSSHLNTLNIFTIFQIYVLKSDLIHFICAAPLRSTKSVRHTTECRHKVPFGACLKLLHQ